MEFIRRNIIKIKIVSLVGYSMFIFLAGPVWGAAEDFPARPITIIVGFPPGAAGGNSALIFAEVAKKYLPNPQPIIVNFKPGAATAIAADYVLKQPADGYTLFSFGVDLPGKLAKDGHLLSFNMEDFIPIGTLGISPQLLAVNKEKSPFKRLEDLLDYAKKHPGQLSYGSGGVGSVNHLTTEIFMARTGIKMNHIPFAGAAPFISALLGGHTDCSIMGLSAAGEHIKSGGGLRVLTIFARERWSELPDVPTSQEKGYNLERGIWYSLAVPKGTPYSVLNILQKIFKKTIDDPQMKAALIKIGFVPLNWDPDETKKLAKEEFDLAKEVYKKSGL